MIRGCGTRAGRAANRRNGAGQDGEAVARRAAPVQEGRMKVALIVLWTLAAGVGLFLMVRSRIIRTTESLAREAARERAGAPRPEETLPDRPGEG
ncbi:MULTISPECIES: hypothetical protein [Methylobacterium]|uniref:hypothetical protein n=1 Tax=Methylobacterium TaxID=407 RepID=UPI0013EB5326|nr:hypothetical protein [Methylobacterium sp. DB0501]NGM38426.1 hypothetical protein [Methylobacterium sp. DB0501]